MNRRRAVLLATYAAALAGAWFLGPKVHAWWTGTGTSPFRTTVADFGIREPGASVEGVYPLHNGTTEMIRVVKLRPDCSCAIASGANLQLKPGETGDIRLTTDTTGRMGRLTVKCFAQLQCGRTQSEVTLLLTGTVELPYYPSSKSISLSRSQMGASSRQFFLEARTQGQVDALYLDMEGVPRCLTADLKPMGGGCAVTVRYAPEKAPEETLRAVLAIRDRRRPEYAACLIAVTVERECACEVFPKFAHFGSVRPAETIERVLTVYPRAGTCAPDRIRVGVEGIPGMAVAGIRPSGTEGITVTLRWVVPEKLPVGATQPVTITYGDYPPQDVPVLYWPG